MKTFQIFLKNGNTFETRADRFKCKSHTGSNQPEIVFYLCDRPLSDTFILASEVAAIIKADSIEDKNREKIYKEDYYDQKF